MASISWDDFAQVDIRAGTIVKAEPFPEARKPAYVVHVDLGEEIGIKKSSAQISAHYKPADLVGKQVVCVVNFPEKQIGSIKSQVLITGFSDSNGDIILTTPDMAVPNGAKLH